MAVTVGINGFGRIGRNVFRAAQGNTALQIVAVNDITEPATLAHLLKYDSILGNYAGRVSADGDQLQVDGRKVKVFAEKDPGALPWHDLGADIVIESTGLFTDARKARVHIDRGGFFLSRGQTEVGVLGPFPGGAARPANLELVVDLLAAFGADPHEGLLVRIRR